ncbi:thioredoxin [Megasphaera sp. AM44-1BH]|jgi:thioredoxin 1|uniref:thioredoxin n=1 Tax=Megasphaera sp. AM44-1BH TaxID=2292358 RepID=UPI001F01F379|nr:thioredoxin [Megasphaera sp. AM44-1BH]
MAIVSLDNESAFTLHVLHKKGIVIVDFWAPWCEPCKMIRAEIQRAAEAFKDQVEVVRVDVDAFHSLAEKYDIMAIPTLLFFKDGKPVKRIIGYASEEEIRKFLATLV